MDDFQNLCNIDVEAGGATKRPACPGCLRPHSACWCPWLPNPRLSINTNILILQHPYEELRKVRTARIVEQAIIPTKIRVVRGRRFCETRFPELQPILSSPKSFLLFPHRDAISADAPLFSGRDSHQPFPAPDPDRWLIVLDGTWTQARNMLCGTPALMSLTKVCLPSDRITGTATPSEFVVRRQPFVGAVSTVEAIARILDLWEPRLPQNDFYRTVLLRPLHHICEVQSAWKEATCG